MWQTLWDSHMKMISNVKVYPCPPCIHSGALDVFQVTNSDGVFLDSLLIMLENFNLANKLGIIFFKKLFYKIHPSAGKGVWYIWSILLEGRSGVWTELHTCPKEVWGLEINDCIAQVIFVC